jgi:metal-responsive CopG/Arc/MetJ family transcriptional regulator
MELPKFKSEGITIKLSSKLKQFLEKISEENQMSQAEFVRYLLQKYMDDYDNRKNS